MMNADHKSLESILQWNLEQILSGHEKLHGEAPIASICGEISDEDVHVFAEKIEAQLYDEGIAKTTIKRVFLVIVEGLQNIIKHGAKNSSGIHMGGCLVFEQDKEFNIYILNHLHITDQLRLENRLKHINALDVDGLKGEYLNVLNNGYMSDKSGAGLGFLTMRMKTLNPINSYFYEIDDKLSGFVMNVRIDKNN
jgi:hypothetical protein